MNNIKERLIKLQEMLNLSITEMAQKCDINYRTMQDYLMQDNKGHKVETLKKIANAYNISIVWLITGEGGIYDSARQTKSMPEAFLIKLKKDLTNKDDAFYNHLTVMQYRIEQVLAGKAILSRYEVVDLATKLQQPVNHYVWLAGYKSEIYDKILGKDIVLSLVNKIVKLPDSDVDNLLSIMDLVLQSYMDRKELQELPIKSLIKKQRNNLDLDVVNNNKEKENNLENNLDYEIF